MFVERSSEVDIEQLLVIEGQSHETAGKLEVAEVVWIHIRQTVRLEGGT